jgi:hypothetical protein
MSQFVRQINELPWTAGKAVRPVPCPRRCRKPTPSTLFVRFHPLRDDAEIRRCPECGREAIFPTGERFRP